MIKQMKTSYSFISAKPGAKRGNEIELIGQLNVAWLLGHSQGSASSDCDT